MRVLVTGFEPFDGRAANSSHAVVGDLAAQSLAGVELATVVLPVRFAAAWSTLRAALAAHEPDVVLALGQASGATGIVVEQVALNLDGPDRPDEDGVLPVDQPIVADAPLAYLSGLPVRSLVSSLRDAGVPTQLSRHAGGHLCNHVFFRLSHLAATERAHLTVGFLHLPHLPHQVVDESVPSMSLAELARAVRHVLCVLPALTVDAGPAPR